MEILLRYLAASVDKDKKQELKEEVKKAISTGDTFMTTIAEEWVREGIEKRDAEITKKMIEKGMSDSDIQAITGLPLSNFSELRKMIKN